MHRKGRGLPHNCARNLKLLAVCLLLSIGSSASPRLAATGQTPSGTDSDGAVLFRLSCASTYCHGEKGKGGGAPGLQGWAGSADKLNRVIAEGIPGTAMPGFSDRFSADELARVVTYVQALSSFSVEESEPARGRAEAWGGSEDRSSGSGLGREVFFDTTKMDNCRVCHTFQGKGGKVGPDLTKIGGKSESDILESILTPSARIEPGYETIEVITRNGRSYTGVKRDENEGRLRLFDTSTMPPVARAIPKADIVSRGVRNVSSMPSHLGIRLSPSELRTLVQFLRGY